MKTSTYSLLTVALLGASSLVSNLFAQANTVPAGYYTVNINAGTGTSTSTSNISFPLQDTATATGQMVGVVTGVTSNTVTNSNAGWTAGQLSVQATPYLIQFTSGLAAGRTLLISTSTANTSTTVTIDSTDASTTNLTTLGIVAGTDTYQIIPADTISSIFGTPATTGVFGGLNSSSADLVQLYNGATWISYYYNTNTLAWTRSAPAVNSNNVVIRPDAGVLYARLGATPMSLVLMGRVPNVPRQSLVSNTSITFLSAYWPTNVTLSASNIQNTPGWLSGASASVSDTIQVYNSGSVWKQYYYNGSHWFLSAPAVNSDTVQIPAGSTIIITKRNASAGQSVLSQVLPYTL